MREKETREKETTERERDKREKTGIKSVRLEDCYRLHRNQQHYTSLNLLYKKGEKRNRYEKKSKRSKIFAD